MRKKLFVKKIAILPSSCTRKMVHLPITEGENTLKPECAIIDAFSQSNNVARGLNLPGKPDLLEDGSRNTGASYANWLFLLAGIVP